MNYSIIELLLTVAFMAPGAIFLGMIISDKQLSGEDMDIKSRINYAVYTIVSFAWAFTFLLLTS